MNYSKGDKTILARISIDKEIKHEYVSHKINAVQNSKNNLGNNIEKTEIRQG